MTAPPWPTACWAGHTISTPPCWSTCRRFSASSCRRPPACRRKRPTSADRPRCGSALPNMQSLCQPLDQSQRVAAAIMQGDLTQKISTGGRDELTQLMTALGGMQSALVRIVGEVRSSTDSIGTASAEIASGNQDLSTRTEQAASNLQQTASSLEQINGTVRQSADAARQASAMAVANAEVAVRGGHVVGQVVSTMDEINHSSKKISDIIGVIDGIAFQTNILALNAAVEAARAKI